MRLASTLPRTSDRTYETFVYAERYLGGGTRTYSPYSEHIDGTPAYHPRVGHRTFALPSFFLRSGQYTWLGNGLLSPDVAHYHDGRALLMPVHPDALSCEELLHRDILAAAEPGPPILVSPTANVRTVFVHAIAGRPVEPHFLKLHYPRRLSRFTRRLRQPIIELELWVAKELDRIRTPFLAEVGGGVIGPDGQGSEDVHAIEEDRWGFILREALPRHAPLPGGSDLMPCFALYGTDHFSPNDPPLLAQIVEHSGEHAEDFITERILAPMIGMWIDALRSAGFLLETHGQNTLFAYDPASRRSAVAYRDCALYISPPLRTQIGLPLDYPPKNVIGLDVKHALPKVLSLVYDRFMGHHHLAYIARAAQQHLGLPEGRLQAAAQAIFRARIGALGSLFPEHEFYYAEELYPNNRWELVDTGERPVWR
ncbi:hypothetical protein [Polyangium aurulentum]|uniref:hypothetical protein n=1 Tax=Polyangium aurulentum TaxID=2567896 RepID=UPI0010AE62EA|nr:hypothetical protein [Polyangium aurulentum]UQA62691.1 hypothetical protein E8A73_020440 [Polyangium aurulentum]